VSYGSRQSFFLHDQIDDLRCRCEADRHLGDEEDDSFCRGLDWLTDWLLAVDVGMLMWCNKLGELGYVASERDWHKQPNSMCFLSNEVLGLSNAVMLQPNEIPPFLLGAPILVSYLDREEKMWIWLLDEPEQRDSDEQWQSKLLLSASVPPTTGLVISFKVAKM
jgi:hypothetical protein